MEPRSAAAVPLGDGAHLLLQALMLRDQVVELLLVGGSGELQPADLCAVIEESAVTVRVAIHYRRVSQSGLRAPDAAHAEAHGCTPQRVRSEGVATLEAGHAPELVIIADIAHDIGISSAQFAGKAFVARA